MNPTLIDSYNTVLLFHFISWKTRKADEGENLKHLLRVPWDHLSEEQLYVSRILLHLKRLVQFVSCSLFSFIIVNIVSYCTADKDIFLVAFF